MTERSNRILFVDDEQNLLDGVRRTLGRTDQFIVDYACGGKTGIEKISAEKYAVIISDMRMPEIDGIQVLAHAKSSQPLAQRILLTGNSDQNTAVQAINRGQIFRFLNKPCVKETLINAITDGIKHHEFVVAENELLQGTLAGSIRVLVEILSLVEPESFAKAGKVRSLVTQLAAKLGMANTWELDIAALLAPLGMATIPKEILSKYHAGKRLSASEDAAIAQVPEIGRKLLSHIPRLNGVAEIVARQSASPGSGGDPKITEEIRLGGCILQLCQDIINIEERGTGRGKALTALINSKADYDPIVLQAATELFGNAEEHVALSAKLLQRASSPEIYELRPTELRVGNVLTEDVVTKTGVLVIPKGSVISASSLAKIHNYHEFIGLKTPIYALAPNMSEHTARG